MKTRMNIMAFIFPLVLAVPATAHHSFYAQFDSNSPITLTGNITSVEWRNPHIWVVLDVENEDGTVTSWRCEGGAPNALVRRGWTDDTLAIGEELSLYGYRAINGSAVCNARSWTYNGRTIFGAPNDDGPAAPAQGQ